MRTERQQRISIPFIASLIICLVLSPVAFSGDTTTRSVTVQVIPQFNGEPLLLSTKNYVSEQGDTLRIDRFRFYISSIQLTLSNGIVYAEKESYHLVDAEDQSSWDITLDQVPKGKIREIHFSIGVDSTRCTSGVFGGELDPSNGMYWAWNSGYIHAKLEGSSPSCKTWHQAFEFHIGGFASPENALRVVTIPVNTNADRIVLTADAHQWLKGIYLATTNSVVMPGEQAMRMADNYSSMFKLLTE